MAHTFIDLAWEKINFQYDEETGEVVNFVWHIQYTLVRTEDPVGTWCGPYFASPDQLPAEPTYEDVDALIMSVFGPGYEALAPETM